MPGKRRVIWKGDDVLDKLLEATGWGVDKTMEQCVDDAKENVPVRTTTLQGSIRLEPHQRRGLRVSGVWGSFDVQYALAVEMGNATLVPKGADTKPDKKTLSTPKNTGNKGFFRGAADKEYPNLADHIADRFEKIR